MYIAGSSCSRLSSFNTREQYNRDHIYRSKRQGREELSLI